MNQVFFTILSQGSQHRMDADQALSLLGKYNRWQLENYVVIAIGFSIFFAWNMMSIVFIGDTPNYRCAIPSNATLNETIPWRITEDGTLEYLKCSMYVNLSTDNKTVPCQYGYWYDPESGYESTLTSEWNLVCGKEWLVELSMTVEAAGSIIGAFIFNKLADRYGRKKVFLGCLWSNTATAMALAFSPNITFYIVVVFINGIQQQGMVSASYILCVELFATEERTFPGNAIEFVWVFGYSSLAVIAYFVRNWRHLQIAISAPFILTLSFYWLTSESIYWLVANGKTEEAERILKKAAKRNKITLPNNLFCPDAKANELELLQCKTEVDPEIILNPNSEKNLKIFINKRGSEHRYKFTELIHSKFIRRYSFVFFTIWFVDSLAYASVNNTVTYLPGNRYLNTLLYALMEVPAYILTWVISQKIGRRLPLIAFHIIGGVAFMSTALQAFSFARHINWLVITVGMIGKLAITASFALIYVIVPELYPTNSRNIALGVCQMSARLSRFISPHARTLYRYMPWVAPLLIGILSTAVGLMSFVIPETRHTKLPDTIDEIEEWRKPIHQ